LILGAGAMGAGIAQVGAQAGWTVLLRDVNDEVVNRAIAGIATQIDRLLEKGKVSASDRDATVSRIGSAADAASLRGCDLVIEAIVEDFEIKTRVLRDLLPSLRSDSIIASNTSSLSITKIGKAIGAPARTVGMHFFNPAPVMRLVEVIAGAKSDPALVDRVGEIARAWGKVVARANDVPGFIVNHIARPYYLEAFRILEDGIASPDEIDRAMKEHGGFRMGPLELTDLIGQDVNAATTRSVWGQLGKPPLLAPSRLQDQLVREGYLGQKAKRGVYDYTVNPPAPVISIDRRQIDIAPALREAVSEFTSRAGTPANCQPPLTAGQSQRTADSLSACIFSRILIAIIAQAHNAYERGVASREDIDTAMKFGVNYPKGPFEWTDLVGAERCVALLRALNETVEDDRFAVPMSLEA
jgi:3-hydroxybutyryl-CoA dehydrogenase